MAVVAPPTSWQGFLTRGRLDVSGSPDPDRRRASKRLGGKVATSPRDSTARERHLPWARCSIPTATRPVKDCRVPAPGRTAADAASSRAASAGSVPPAPRPATAPPPASGPRGSGGAGGPASATARPTTASSAAATRASAIANGSASAAPRWPRARPRPRASAQTPFRKILRAAPATAPAATSCSARPRVPPTGASVPRPAARRYGASGSATCGARSGGAPAPGPGDYGSARHREASADVVTYFSPRAIALFLPPTPRAEEGAGGAGPLRPPVSFL
jgi:hypothetical protein